MTGESSEEDEDDEEDGDSEGCGVEWDPLRNASGVTRYRQIDKYRSALERLAFFSAWLNTFGGKPVAIRSR